MRSRSLLVGLLAVLTQSGPIDVSYAEGDPASAPPPKAIHRKHATSARHAALKAPPETPAAAPMAPWAAVDPTRAGATAPPETTAMPGVHHVVQPDQDRMSVGMKWNSSNASANQYSTQGVVNEVNHDLGAPNTVGTDAEMGLKLHF